MSMGWHLPDVRFSAPIESDPNAYERPSGSSEAQAYLRLIRSDGNYQTRSLTVSLDVGGTATTGLDYTPPITPSVRFEPGEWFKMLPITAIDDSIAEPTETIDVTLADGDGYDISPYPEEYFRTMRIMDNEPTVTVIAADSYAAESGTPATNIAKARFIRSGSYIDQTQPLPVNYSIINNEMTASDADYEPLARIAVIPAGSNFVDVEIKPVDDAIGDRPRP